MTEKGLFLLFSFYKSKVKLKWDQICDQRPLPWKSVLGCTVAHLSEEKLPQADTVQRLRGKRKQVFDCLSSLFVHSDPRLSPSVLLHGSCLCGLLWYKIRVNYHSPVPGEKWIQIKLLSWQICSSSKLWETLITLQLGMHRPHLPGIGLCLPCSPLSPKARHRTHSKCTDEGMCHTIFSRSCCSPGPRVLQNIVSNMKSTAEEEGTLFFHLPFFRQEVSVVVSGNIKNIVSFP